MTHECEESDRVVVPEKSPNKAERTAAEAMEGRTLAKGNSRERNAPRTQRRTSTPSALERVRQAAKKDRKQRFTALLHHVYDVERLRLAYRSLKRDAAAGGRGPRAHGNGREVAGAHLVADGTRFDFGGVGGLRLVEECRGGGPGLALLGDVGQLMRDDIAAGPLVGEANRGTLGRAADAARGEGAIAGGGLHVGEGLAEHRFQLGAVRNVARLRLGVGLWAAFVWTAFAEVKSERVIKARRSEEALISLPGLDVRRGGRRGCWLLWRRALP